MVRTMVEAIVTSAQPPPIFFLFSYALFIDSACDVQGISGKYSFFRYSRKKGRFPRNSVAILAHHKTE